MIAETKPGRGGEIQLTDSLARLAVEEGLLALQFEGQRYDTGDKLGFIEATIAFALKRPDLADGTRKILAQYAEK
jgi:UTP--glucose-1-phosphate uridylyltransferase